MSTGWLVLVNRLYSWGEGSSDGCGGGGEAGTGGGDVVRGERGEGIRDPRGVVSSEFLTGLTEVGTCAGGEGGSAFVDPDGCAGGGGAG